MSAEKRRLREVESALEEVRKKLRVLRSEQATLEDERKTLEQIIKSQVRKQTVINSSDASHPSLVERTQTIS